ncbi:unknown [[Mannheimia] succiniciproducens MBEL55E]|uniref:Uncharacterized protein n=1 Tax=Mannheimia succiniciproducens (strain KCTC 0769BP / MBEL55E) TaxID=221988 RepID=Q65QS6_MANSM|nr:unknown [[Mannheimia] succiniciproducens MBEL55E]
MRKIHIFLPHFFFKDLYLSLFDSIYLEVLCNTFNWLPI